MRRARSLIAKALLFVACAVVVAIAGSPLILTVALITGAAR